MITLSTVFVFGAGVSMPYGFPSGKTLLNQIYAATRLTKTDLSNEKPTLFEIGIMLREEFGDKLVMEFGNELFLSQQTSIDAFLEHRPEFLKIGKTAIALCIARMENDEKLFSMDTRDKGCYQYLFQKMNSSWDEFAENKVAFITFNYDRSLEEYLFSALKHTYGKPNEECAPQINRIPIVHVHGYLGPLPWESKDGISYNYKFTYINGYGEVFDAIYRERMRDNIIVISEGQDESVEFKQAYDLLENANKVYFLGFGYHPTNLRRLKVDRLIADNKVFGSAKGLEDAEVLSVSRYFSYMNYERRKTLCPDNSSDSLLFLRKYAELS